MSTTYQDYRNRVQFKGKTKRDYVNTKVRESIDSLVDESQYGFTITLLTKDPNTKEEIRNDYDVAILSTKSTQDYERANIIAHNEVGLDRGSLFEWNEEKWIVLQKMFRPEQPGFNGYAYRCTGALKWIDKDGRLQVRPGYISSGRTTNSLTYTPDVNYKMDNILLHDTDWSMIAAIQQDFTIHNEMRFIIKGKAYRVTNIDNVSIDNVSILSLVDDKLLDSDIVYEDGTGIASETLYKLKSDIQLPMQLFAGDIKAMPVSVYEHGELVEEEIIYSSSNPEIAEIQNDTIIGRGIGECIITCSLKKNPVVTMEFKVSVTAEHTEDTPVYYIIGPDTLAWNTVGEYRLSNGAETNFEVDVFSKMRPIININSDSVLIKLKDRYGGNIVITTEYEGNIIKKDVVIKTA